MLATWVVFKAPSLPGDDATFHPVTIKVPPPPPQPPAAAGGEAANALEPDLTVTPPPTPVSMIASLNPSSFKMDATKVQMPNLPPSLTQPSGSSLAGNGATGAGSGAGNPFGSSFSNGNDLPGYFYDLKQTPDKHPSAIKTDPAYFKMLSDFALLRNWDESLLANYYKSPNSLFTHAVMIPIRDSSEGPKAFGLEKDVQPGGWVILYEGTVQAPAGGDYRFAGFSDNQMYVQVDGSTVLDTGTQSPAPQLQEKYLPNEWFPLGNPKKWPAHYAEVRVGSSFHVDIARDIKLKILIGDALGAKGNMTCHFLFLMKEGETYANGPGGEPKLPLFRLNAAEVQPEGKFPPFITADYATWAVKSN